MCCLCSINPPLYAGKTGGSAVTKNKKKKTAGTEKSSSSGSYKIPKKMSAVEPDSEDEARGTTFYNSSRKFGDTANRQIHSIINSKALLPNEMSSLCENMEKLIIGSVSNQTWAKHNSALNLYKEFCKIFSVKFVMPVAPEYIRAFATWAISARKLKSSTVKSYISSINVAHTLCNFSTSKLSSDPCLKMILKGAENTSITGAECKTNRLPMNIHLLNILGHKIAQLDWAVFSKQVVWTACIVSFFSSCRMGELLPEKEFSYDPLTTLTWSKVNFVSKTEVVIFIPYTKTTGFKGKLIDIFKVNINGICPAAAMHRLKYLASLENLYKPENPVFSFKNGIFLTRKKLNFYLATLLDEFTDPFHKITGHSFRAGIPSALAASSYSNYITDIKDWGHWSSDSYLLYTKQESEKRKTLFNRIVKSLFEQEK